MTALVSYSFSLTGHKTKREQKAALIAAMQELPQADLPTKHYWASDLCARECVMKKGESGVGAVYKKSHLMAVMQGHIRIDMDGELIDLVAPIVREIQAGTQKAILAIEDSVALTFFGTKEKMIEAVCSEFTTSSYDEIVGQPRNMQLIKNQEKLCSLS